MSDGQYWLTYKPVTVDLTKLISMKPVGINKKLHAVIELPVFSINTHPSVLNTSYITLEFIGHFTQMFSFPFIPHLAPANADFCLGVRYLDSNNNVVRYKFWEGVQEVIPGVAVYNGERIAKDFVLEVWSTQKETITKLTSVYTLATSMLTMPVDCCDTEQIIMSVTEACELWALLPIELPVLFDSCVDLPYIPGYNILVNESFVPILTESGDYIIVA